MKILKIEFQNINSLKGTHEIDFTSAPFTASSLFAITGPTGSGKSTILDVISLALFNHVPRLGKISKNEILNKGAILTRNQKEAFAKITFESKSGKYASLWSISTNRNNKLRDYEMQIFDLSTEKALDLKKSDVPARNEELIGLSYEQFIKAVLLAQGEFAQFLKAKKDERGELLEKITGTGIYRQLGIKAFQKKKEVSIEIEKEQQEIELHQKNLLEDEDLKLISEELSQKTENCKPVEKAVKEIDLKIRVKKEIQEQISQIEIHQQKKTAAQNNLEVFEKEHGLSLKKHEKIQLFGEELRNWKQLNSTREELKNEITAIGQRLEINDTNITHCLEEIRKFIKADPKAENIEKELQNFTDNIKHLQNRRDEKLNSYRSLQKEFSTEVREVPFQLNGDLDSAEHKLQEMRGSIIADLDKLKPLLSEIDLDASVSEKNRLRKQLEKSRKAEQQAGKLKNLSAELKKLQLEQEIISRYLEELPKKIHLGTAHVETLNEKFQKLQLRKENENLRKTLNQHRLHLHDGQPCPLCGALEHPYAEDLPRQQDGLQEEINSVEKELAEKNRELTGNQTSLKHYEQSFEELRNSEKTKQKDLNTEKGVFESEFGEMASGEETDWAALVSSYDRQIAGLEKFEHENRRLKAISAGLPLLKDLMNVKVQGKEVKEELDSLYSGENIDIDCRELQKKWTGFQHQKSTLANLSKELDEKLSLKSRELRHLEESLTPKIENVGCKDISEALERLLPEQKAAELRKNKEELTNETARIEATLKTLTGQLCKLKKNDPDKTQEDLTTELQEKQQTLENWNKECEELRRKLVNDKEIRLKITRIETGLSEKKKHIRRWELLNQLIGDSTGKKFNDFAQDLSLSQLLQHANIRLKDLSDRYHIDKPVADEDDSLVAIDEHMGGQRRSVKTLSGGETFILSLSMALALSDLASKNVEINSLFIDEGFGTLDPETLDQTLDTLEKLQAESSKTIGIISHVDSLKERIATQIQLKRNGQGYSSLEVTN